MVCPCRPWASLSFACRPSTFVAELACLAWVARTASPWDGFLVGERAEAAAVSPRAEVVADEPALVSLPAEELADSAAASPRAEVVADEPGLASLLAEERAESAVAFPPAAEGDSAVASRPALAEARAEEAVSGLGSAGAWEAMVVLRQALVGARAEEVASGREAALVGEGPLRESGHGRIRASAAEQAALEEAVGVIVVKARDGSQILPDPGETDHPDLLTRMIEARGR